MAVENLDFASTPYRDGAVGAIPNRLNWRAEVLLNRNIGDVSGKRVLDIASADGRFSYACAKLGAAHVTGVEGREDQVQLGRESLAVLNIDPLKCELRHADIFDYLPACQPGQFDTILCFGFFYHTMRQMELLQQIVRLQPKAVILDTTVVLERRWLKVARFLWRARKHPNPANWSTLWNSIEGDEIMYFKTEHADHASGSIVNNFYARADWEKGHLIAANFKPTESMVERLMDVHGMRWEQIDWFAQGIDNWSGLYDYSKRFRVSYKATLE